MSKPLFLMQADPPCDEGFSKLVELGCGEWFMEFVEPGCDEAFLKLVEPGCDAGVACVETTLPEAGRSTL